MVTVDVPAAEPARSSAPLWVLVFLALATVVAVNVDNGSLVVALLPAFLLLLVWAVWVVPLRVPMLVLLVLAWALDAPGDAFAAGKVVTPWHDVGIVLWGKLNLTIPWSPLVVSGFDLLALLFLAAIVHRRAQRSSLDRTGWVEAPQPIAVFAWVSFAAALWMSAYGLARGGSFRFVLWQSVRWVYLPIVYFLMAEALRGARDIAVLGKLVLGVGLFRAGEAILVRDMFPSKELLPHATTHADSVLFVTCLAILGAALLEAPGRRTLKWAAMLVPVFIWALFANNRRLAWAEVALVTLFFWLVTAWRPLKRKLARMLALAALPLLLYTAVGWNLSGGGFPFGPVRKFRSMLDSRTDTSTLWRDLENFNLIYTYKEHPLLGSGFGHPMVEHIKLPDVTRDYELEPFIPHNSVLGIWAFGGLVGFSLLWMVFPVGMFFTVRAYRWARTPLERVGALGAGAAQVCYLMQGYGDLGFGSWGPVFTVAAAYALVGKICVANGAWGARKLELREAAS
jgi:O-antigen ligase